MSTTFLDVKAICLNPRDGGGGGGARCVSLSPGSGSHYRDRAAPRRPPEPASPRRLPPRLTRYRAGTAFYLEHSASLPTPPSSSLILCGERRGGHTKYLQPSASIPPSCFYALLGGGLRCPGHRSGELGGFRDMGRWRTPSSSRFRMPRCVGRTALAPPGGWGTQQQSPGLVRWSRG